MSKGPKDRTPASNVKTILCRGWYHPQGVSLRENKKYKCLLSLKIAALAASPFLFAGAAFAGPYVNVETNSNWTGDDYTSTSTELQLGYEGSNWYVSGGPIVSSPDNGESSTDFIGYVGGSLDLTESVGAYGEISLLTDETADNAYTVKVGAKYTF